MTNGDLDKWAIFTINYATRAPDCDIPALLEPWIVQAARRVKERHLILDAAGRALIESLAVAGRGRAAPMNFLHYIGGWYTPVKFIKEARKFGITRHIAPNAAKNMNYGDYVILLNWRKGSPIAFAEFVVETIAADHEIMQAVTAQLKEEGHVLEDRPSGTCRGGMQVDRECESFMMGGGAVIDDETTIKDVVKKGERIAIEKGVEPKWMVGGDLTRVFNPPLALEPVPPFTRGFLKVPDNPFGSNGSSPDKLVISVEHYQKRKRRRA